MLKEEIYGQGKKAKAAARTLGQASEALKNAALSAMAKALLEKKEAIIRENDKDLAAGKKAGLSPALLDRLSLDEGRIEAMAQGLVSLISLKDPVGTSDEVIRRPNGLEIAKIRVPLGVVGMIYEARPNVTVDAAGLCIKTGNAVLLRGGSTAAYSNRILTDVMSQALVGAGLDGQTVQQIASTDRAAVDIMMTMTDYLDVLIPRGGQGLIDRVVKGATVPVIETGTGVCHAYLDSGCDPDMALDIVENAKTQRPGVCNALETVLIHKDLAESLLPRLEKRLDTHQVVLKADPVALGYLNHGQAASLEDYGREYLDYILTVKVVDDLTEAIDHIETYGTHHSDVIVTQSYERARTFLAGVNSACVYVNASTRFTDGEMFGFGAEIGISTQKLHARGPMGLRALTSHKYVVYGSGQIRG